jgi:hypothetical protein
MHMVLITGLHCSRFTCFCPELKSGVVVTGVVPHRFRSPVGGRWSVAASAMEVPGVGGTPQGAAGIEVVDASPG